MESLKSPIDLSDTLIKHEETELFEIPDITEPFSSELMNNGGGIIILVSPQKSPSIKGGVLPYQEYVVIHISFHWDSEHTINKEKFVLEVQIITIAKECQNFETALLKGGVSIFSILYTLSDEENPGLAELIPSIPIISQNIDKRLPYDILKLSHFLPNNLNQFYRYNGSLTFPPFTPGVIWTIFTEKQLVTRPQMGLLCDIYDEEGKLVVYNNSVPTDEKSDLHLSEVVKKKCQCPPPRKMFKKSSKTLKPLNDVDHVPKDPMELKQNNSKVPKGQFQNDHEGSHKTLSEQEEVPEMENEVDAISTGKKAFTTKVTNQDVEELVLPQNQSSTQKYDREEVHVNKAGENTSSTRNPEFHIDIYIGNAIPIEGSSEEIEIQDYNSNDTTESSTNRILNNINNNVNINNVNSYLEDE